MNIHDKAVLAVAVLAMALTGCSGKTDTSTSATPEAATPQTQPQGVASAPEAVGAVQRDYPSVAEETALKLNYPVFLAYGKDSARITPFFPGSKQQPVSVKLAPNAAGYSLDSEGTACAYPIDYALKSADGKQLAGGEYKSGAAAGLAGWDAQVGSAVLTVRMADGAKNNFGCNLVVNKK